MKLSLKNSPPLEVRAHKIQIPGWGWLDIRVHWKIDDGRECPGVYQISEYTTGQALMPNGGWGSIRAAITVVEMHLKRFSPEELLTRLAAAPKINN